MQLLSSWCKSGFKELFSKCFSFWLFSLFRPLVTIGQSNTSSKPGTLCYGLADTNILVPANAILKAKELYSSVIRFQVWKEFISIKKHARGLETVIIWALKICCTTKILTFQSLGHFGGWPGGGLVLDFAIDYPLFGLFSCWGFFSISKATSSSIFFSSNLPAFLRPPVSYIIWPWLKSGYVCGAKSVLLHAAAKKVSFSSFPYPLAFLFLHETLNRQAIIYSFLSVYKCKCLILLT